MYLINMHLYTSHQHDCLQQYANAKHLQKFKNFYKFLATFYFILHVQVALFSVIYSAVLIIFAVIFKPIISDEMSQDKWVLGTGAEIQL